MKNLKNKLTAVFLIFTLSVSFFFLKKPDYTLPVMAVSYLSENDKSLDFSFGNNIDSGTGSLSLDVGSFLRVDMGNNSRMKFSSYSSGEFAGGSAILNSLYDFNLKISTGSSLKLNNSSLFIKGGEGDFKIIGLKGVSALNIAGNDVYITPGYSINFKFNKTNSNISDSFEIIRLFDHKQASTVNLNAKKTKAYLNKFNSFGTKNVGSNLFVFFDKKRSDKVESNKMYIFSQCTDAIGDFMKKNTFAVNVKNVCFDNMILEDEYLSELLLRNINIIPDISDRYELLTDYNLKLRRGFTIFDKLALLEEGLSKGDTFFVASIISKIRDDVKKNVGTKNLTNFLIAYDSLMKHYSGVFPKEGLFLRWEVEDEILSSFDSDIALIKNVSDYHFKLISYLIDEREFVLLENIFDKRTNILKDLSYVNLGGFDTSFVDRMQTLEKTYLVLKNTLHGSAISGEELEKETLSQEIEEDEIKKFIASLSKKPKVRAVNDFKYSDLIGLLDNHGFKIERKNIQPYMNGGSLFKLKGVDYDGMVFDSHFNYKNKTFFSINLNGTGSALPLESYGVGKNEDELVGSGSSLIGSVRVDDLGKFLTAKEESVVYDDQPSDVFSDISYESFSYYNILRREMLRTYLENVGVYTNSKYIEEDEGDLFKVDNAYVESDSGKVNLSFDIVLKKWNVSNLKMIDYPEQEIYKEVVLGSDIEEAVSTIFEIIYNREKNKDTLISRFSGFFIDEETLTVSDELKFDGFNVDLNTKYSSGDFEINGTYYVEDDNFTNVTAYINDESKAWENISISVLNDNLEQFNIDIVKGEQIKIEIKKEEWSIDYQDIPDELINGDWINEL